MVSHVQTQPFPAAKAASGSASHLIARIGRQVWNALHAIGARRARRELVRLAASCEQTNPELAAQLRGVIREDWLSRS